MRRTPPGAMPLALALAASSLSAAQPDTGILWLQTDHDAGVQLSSQNFEASFDAFDTQGADDFVVPEGEVWIVKQIEVQGSYGSGPGPARSENVAFYRNANGAPGSILKEYPNLVGTPIHYDGFLITLAEPLKLKPGKHWVSVQVNMDFAVGGQWGWMTRTARVGSRAVWKNPVDGFDTGCTTYQPMKRCANGYGLGPDFSFTLYGKLIPGP